MFYSQLKVLIHSKIIKTRRVKYDEYKYQMPINFMMLIILHVPQCGAFMLVN